MSGPGVSSEVRNFEPSLRVGSHHQSTSNHFTHGHASLSQTQDLGQHDKCRTGLQQQRPASPNEILHPIGTSPIKSGPHLTNHHRRTQQSNNVSSPKSSPSSPPAQPPPATSSRCHPSSRPPAQQMRLTTMRPRSLPTGTMQRSTSS